MEFRTLTADEIELRVGATTQKGFSLLLYKTARTDMQLLDEVVGSMNWKREHQVIDGFLCCTISVWDDEKKQWISKQDVGTENQMEREKSTFSDAMKRAGFNFGIGRELYSAPFIWISGHVEEDKRAKSGFRADQRFVGGLKVSEIEYNEKRCITKLVIEDADCEIVYIYGGNKSFSFDDKKKTEPKPKKKDAPKETAPKKDSVISAEHAQDIKDGLAETDSNVEAFLSLFQTKSVDEMHESQYAKAMQMIEKKRRMVKGGN